MVEVSERPEITRERLIELLVVRAFPVRADGTVELHATSAFKVTSRPNGDDSVSIRLKRPGSALKHLHKLGLSDDDIQAALARYQAREDVQPQHRLVKVPDGRPLTGWLQVQPVSSGTGD